MTYEQIFSGRMLLMRVQRHIAQAGILTAVKDGVRGIPWPETQFTTPDKEEAFFLVEGLLCGLEKQFDTKVKAEKKKGKRRALHYRANQQVRKGGVQCKNTKSYAPR